MRRRIIVTALVLLLGACAPGFDGTPVATTTTAPVGSPQAEFEAARTLWASAGPDDYTFEFIDDCGECLPARRNPRRVAVLDGTVLAVDSENLLTVEEVFASIGQALDEGRDVQVTYDPQTGAPVDVQIDMDMRPVDGGTHWVFTDFTEFQPVGSAAELLEARRSWEALQLDDYQFVMRVDCGGCTEQGAFDVKVVDDRIVEVARLDRPGEFNNVTPVTIDRTFDDFEEWFTDREALIAQGILEVEIRVDPIMGYPRWVYVEAENPADSTEVFTGIVTMDLVSPYVPDDSPDSGDVIALQEARNLWEFTAIADYRYTMTVHCPCPEEFTGPFEITVRDQQVASATWKGNPLGPEQGPVYTIEQVFDLIQKTIEGGKDVEVVYDPESGYPANVVLDVEAVAVDGGLAFSISNLQPLGEPGIVAGRVLAGPTCPVQQDPPDPACADRPVNGAVLVVVDETGMEVARVTSNPDGFFEISLEPGTYRIEPRPVEGLLGTAPPFELDVISGFSDQVTVSYDTGIR